MNPHRSMRFGGASQNPPEGLGIGSYSSSISSRPAIASVVLKSRMPNQQPRITTVNGRRQFSCSAVALQAIIVNSDEQVLLLSSPTRNRGGAWQVVSGALEAEETILAGTLREVREEVGPAIQVRPLGPVHVCTFRYD